jgi:cell division protein FtsW
MWKTPSILVGIVLLLLALGIIMLASASSVKGDDVHKDPNYFLRRQLVFLAAAVGAGVVAASVDYHRWQKYWIPVAVFAMLLLVLVLVPHIGAKIGGSRRWLKLGPISLQPSEFAKFAVVVALGAWITQMGQRIGTIKDGILKPCFLLCAILGLVFLEPDFGTTILLASVGGLLLFLGGSPPGWLGLSGLIGACGISVAVLFDDNRRGRILAFIMPDKYPAAAYQANQSEDAFTLGGFWGAGLGESIQKHYYLPEAHTDFILAIIGEELGLIATITVVVLFAALFVCGLLISLRARDQFGRLLGLGLTLMITVQAMINIGVVTGCLPTKGLPLPFISYGGSSLVISMINIGVLINIARQGIWDSSKTPIGARDRARWL